MKNNRPIYLNLTQIRLPVTALVSILHRISGIVLFLALPFLLYLFSLSLASESSFLDMLDCLQCPLTKIVLWVILCSTTYHLLAGLRHLLMDFGYGESRCAACAGAYAMLIIFLVLALLIGWWLW